MHLLFQGLHHGAEHIVHLTEKQWRGEHSLDGSVIILLSAIVTFGITLFAFFSSYYSENARKNSSFYVAYLVVAMLPLSFLAGASWGSELLLVLMFILLGIFAIALGFIGRVFSETLGILITYAFKCSEVAESKKQGV